MSEQTQETPSKSAKKETVYEAVTMTDGRVVQFPGDQKVKKAVLFDEGTATGVQFDFRNGETRTVHLTDLQANIVQYSACHGLLQKIGDEWSGTKELDDIVLTCDEMIKRLVAGDWAVERAAGDSLAGASIVIKALMEATGKDVGAIKAFLDGKIEAAKAKGEKLTRQALYASFRNPTSKVGQIIRRLEDEKAAKGAAVDADALVSELAG